MKKISVIIKEPGKPPRHVNISDRLENLQNTVGGYIEAVRISDHIVIICNEDGKLKGLPLNRITGGLFYGTIIFAGVDGENFCDFPLSFSDFKKIWEAK